MNYAIIVGAGKSTRMNEKINKIFLTLADKPVIYHTIKVFEDCEKIDKIIIVTQKENIEEIEKIKQKYDLKKIGKVIEGGIKRQDSVYSGIRAIEDPNDDDIVLIHNAANPLVDEKTIIDSINIVKEHNACVVGFPVEDTIKEVKGNEIIKTLDRKKLWQVQTPQTAKYSLLKEAFEKAYKDNFYGTDDVSLIERLGKKVKILECSKNNIKITTPADLMLINKIKSNTRLGIGLDSHRFTNKDKPLILGGVMIPNEKGLQANSDGDVILHSLFNAISQSMGNKSISYYADPLCKKGITDSKEYLKIAVDMVKDYEINNVGVMIEAKKPKISPYEEKIKENIAKLLNIDKKLVGITATSGEELTEFGKGKGIQATTIVSLTLK